MRRRFARRRGRRLKAVFFLLLIAALSFWVEKRLPLVEPELFSNALCRRAETVIAKTVPLCFEKLSVHTDQDIVLPDTYTLSKIKAELTTTLQRKLSRNICMWIPVGNLTGLMLFNGHGPRIPVMLSVESAVQITFETEMEAAGINRTRYGLCMNVSAKLYGVSVAFPGSAEVETRYPVYEAVLEGKVPQVVTNLH